jgi:hypothetical protein
LSIVEIVLRYFEAVAKCKLIWAPLSLRSEIARENVVVVLAMSAISVVRTRRTSPVDWEHLAISKFLLGLAGGMGMGDGFCRRLPTFT